MIHESTFFLIMMVLLSCTIVAALYGAMKTNDKTLFIFVFILFAIYSFATKEFGHYLELEKALSAKPKDEAIYTQFQFASGDDE